MYKFEYNKPMLSISGSYIESFLSLKDPDRNPKISQVIIFKHEKYIKHSTFRSKVIKTSKY